MKKQLVRIIPEPLEPLFRKIYYFPLDIIDMMRDPNRMVPPRSMIFVGAGDFLKIGEGFKDIFITLANLQPNQRVLDVGCGIGRIAIPLTNYLSQEGEYWGFDIVKKGIDWCQDHISSKFKNFHFIHVDLYNKLYNPKGKIQAREFRFPFDNDYFDFIFLTSVFTHMLPLDLENYLSEISRVLKAGGKCLTTFFLLNDESEALIRAGLSSFDFKYETQGCLTITEDRPEDGIAYKEDTVIDLFEKYGLSIIQPIYYGDWCKRESFFGGQDVLIAKK